jgi:hypothetical protein
MAKKFQFQRVRAERGKPRDDRDYKDRNQTVLEPVDVALLLVILLVVFWLQWLMGTMTA